MKNLIKTLQIYFSTIKIYNIEELIKLKELITRRIRNTTRIPVLKEDILEFIAKAPSEFHKDYLYLQRLQSDLSKIKKAIAFNNAIFCINKLIFKREVAVKMRDHLANLQSIYADNKKSLIPIVNQGKAVETVIYDLISEIEVIDKQLKLKNTSAFYCTLLRLKENYK